MAATATEAVETVVRTIRFEIVWPGWRRSDLLGHDDASGLWREIWRAQDDLRQAANRAISVLWQCRMGTMKLPGGVSEQTAAYQLFSGKWQPTGEPCYRPSPGTRPVGSSTLNATKGMVLVRLKTDALDIKRGEKSLPTFRNMPFAFLGSTYTVDQATGAVNFPLWGGRAQRVTVRPRKLDPSRWAMLRSAVKFGDGRLIWSKPPGRKGKWYLALALHLPKKKETQDSRPLVAAVRLGMGTTCALAYAEGGSICSFGDTVHLPSSTWRAVQRVTRERRERGFFNRKEHGIRAGRGRFRKLRAVEPLSDKVARVTRTAIEQTAAAVVGTAKRRGAYAIALPDLGGWSVSSELDNTADLPEGSRAERRKWYFRWHQGALRQQIREVAEREGLDVLDVSVSGSRATCSYCGNHDPAGRIGDQWRCPCGAELTAEMNSARILVSRAIGKESMSQPVTARVSTAKRSERRSKPRRVGKGVASDPQIRRLRAERDTAQAEVKHLEQVVAADPEMPPEALEASLGLNPRCEECDHRTEAPGKRLCARCERDEEREREYQLRMRRR